MKYAVYCASCETLNFYTNPLPENRAKRKELEDVKCDRRKLAYDSKLYSNCTKCNETLTYTREDVIFNGPSAQSSES